MPNQSEYPYRSKDLCDNVNNFLYKIGNEPSVAAYRIQEHVYKTVPTLARERNDIVANEKKLKGTTYDVDYTRDFLSKLDEAILISRNTREKISELASKISAKSNKK